MPASKRPKLSPEEQSKLFIDTAREVGASESEADFDVAIKRVTRSKSESSKKPPASRTDQAG